MSTVNWHFPRKHLAEKAMLHFEPGPAHGLAIFERRRMGKTEFLRYDLTPYAEKAGWGVKYYSFMLDAGQSSKTEPLADFFREMADFAMTPLDKAASKAGKLLRKSPIKKIAVPGVGEFEVAPSADEKPVSLGELFQAVVARHGKALLILDEIQTLTTGSKERRAQNLAFLGALRTVLDTNKEVVRVIFNGSSLNGLQMMLGMTGAAFYRYCSPFDFPKLDGDYIRHLLTILSIATTGPRHIAPAPERFIELFMTEMDRCPYYPRKLIEKLISAPSLSIDDAWNLVRADDRTDASAEWGELTGLQREILTFLAKGGVKPYSRASLAVLSGKMGVPLGVPAVQSSLKSLCKGGGGAGDILVNKGKGGYEFQDENFRSLVEGGNF